MFLPFDIIPVLFSMTTKMSKYDPDPAGSVTNDLLDRDPKYRITEPRIRILYGSTKLLTAAASNKTQVLSG